LLVGTAGSGKSSLLANLLEGPYARQFDNIHWFSPSAHTLPKSFREKLADERVYNSLDSLRDVIQETKDSDETALFIFDDCVKMIAENVKTMMDLAFNRRHLGAGAALIIVTQKTRAIPLVLRSAVDSLAFFSLRNKSENQAVFEDYLSNFLEPEEFKAISKYVAETGAHPFLFSRLDLGKVYNKFNELDFESDSSDDDN
jgi:GTPase SAR1 family protein